jgi:NAD(P)-dependent dehydrogenase (short-subunit alcohol dehydrogenase family)
MTASGHRVIPIACDVSDESQAEAAVRRTVETFGRLDMAYNNAVGDGIDPAAMKEFLRDQPIGRMGRADEVAASVLWLCSPGASFGLGVALPVDGGFVAH